MRRIGDGIMAMNGASCDAINGHGTQFFNLFDYRLATSLKFRPDYFDNQNRRL